MKRARRACLLLFAAATALPAQTLRGRLTTRDGTAVPGALVTLLDESARPVRATVSRRSGEFVFNTGRAGRYSLRVERVGQPVVTGEPFTVGPAQTVRLRVQVEPQRRGLEGIRAGGAACRAGGPSGVAAALWEHAARALRVVALAEEAGVVQPRGVRYTRRLASPPGSADSVIAQQPFAGEGMPFPELEPAAAVALDFAGRDSAGTAALLVPSPAVLLSAAFHATHCFDRVFAEVADTRTGLHFTPLPGSAEVGVEGVLWLDRETAELRTLEFRYRDPRGDRARGADGLIAFANDEGGLPVMSRWRVRQPQASPDGRPAGLIEAGALVFGPGDAPLADPDGVLASLAGVVAIDSLLVAARKAELMPDAPWRWTQGALDLLPPTELVHAPQPDAFAALLALRPMWLSRRGSTPYCPPPDPTQLAARANCIMRQPAVYLENVPVDGEDLEDKLTHIPLATVGGIEYIRPLEAFMIFGGRGNSSNGVILVHTRRF